VNLPDLFAIVDEVTRRQAELKELRRAVGRWPWRVKWIRASAGKDLSETTALMLALITFDGYELFPAHEHPRQSPGDRDL
jgi:hypothetical protein